MPKDTRVQVRGKGWAKPITIDREKFEVMSKALLASLTSEPVPFGTLVESVARRLPDFDGSISWYAITCARELETQGKLVRQARPVRYLKAKAGSSRGQGASGARPAKPQQADASPSKTLERVFKMSFAGVYPHYVNKVEKKGRTVQELDEVLCWLTGYTPRRLAKQIEREVDFTTFFSESPGLHPNAGKVTGVVCGVRIEQIEDPLMRKIRIMDKLVDELAKGRPLAKILRP